MVARTPYPLCMFIRLYRIMGTCRICIFKNQNRSHGGFWLVCVHTVLDSEIGTMDVGSDGLHSELKRAVKNAGIRPQRAHRTRAEARDKRSKNGSPILKYVLPNMQANNRLSCEFSTRGHRSYFIYPDDHGSDFSLVCYLLQTFILICYLVPKHSAIFKKRIRS